ncbi:FAD1 [Candida theae]|uniref:FAD synthase n=1 Tax=Candida theae TaxID=1198502 RepID=A0AAD5BCN0_9ASCO|nr:FAD1 [Candida theae]KAI5955526.1 FAD1 [Candida theae]
MTQELTQQQIGFFERCKECYHLVQNFLNDTLPNGLVSPRHNDYEYDPDLRQKVKEKITSSMEKLEKSINLHGLKEIAISYNGGKDCLVMLILLLASIYKKFLGTHEANRGESFYSSGIIPHDYKLDSIYVNAETPFPQLTKFITQSTEYYHLNPVYIKDSIKNGFEHYLNEINTNIKSVVVGIRHTDPYGEQLEDEQRTDSDWPSFLRIHPILDWKYVEIWDFLVGSDVDYCSLYDEGYTSLGGVNTTIPNPKLLIPSEEKNKYLPAYMLKDNADALERLGRVKSRK